MFQSAVVEYDVDVANPMREEEAVLLTLLLPPNFHFPTGTRQLLSLFLPPFEFEASLNSAPSLTHPTLPSLPTPSMRRPLDLALAPLKWYDRTPSPNFQEGPMDHGWDDANLHFSPIIPPRCKIPLEPSSTAMGGCCMRSQRHPRSRVKTRIDVPWFRNILCYEKVPNINKYVII